ncbi:MAG: nucleotidyltransferase domain-containing protein [Candidatus Jacksonbacteria bacterium]|nr:nucleotidyltransferase domain-containing protein [Candidatus Jacksonbacteria bacterium]
MSDTQTKQTIREIKSIVRQYVRSLEERNFPIKQAFLFGSYAKGNFKSHSDIDVCVISDRFNNEKVRLKIWQLRHDIDIRIQPIIYHPRDFKRYDPLVHEIMTHGIRIK